MTQLNTEDDFDHYYNATNRMRERAEAAEERARQLEQRTKLYINKWDVVYVFSIILLVHVVYLNLIDDEDILSSISDFLLGWATFVIALIVLANWDKRRRKKDQK